MRIAIWNAKGGGIMVRIRHGVPPTWWLTRDDAMRFIERMWEMAK